MIGLCFDSWDSCPPGEGCFSPLTSSPSPANVVYHTAPPHLLWVNLDQSNHVTKTNRPAVQYELSFNCICLPTKSLIVFNTKYTGSQHIACNNTCSFFHDRKFIRIQIIISKRNNHMIRYIWLESVIVIAIFYDKKKICLQYGWHCIINDFSN